MTKSTKERAHNPGSEFTREGTSASEPQSTIDQIVDMADKAVDQATEMGKVAMEKDNLPKVAAGAGLGALAGMILPIVSLPVAAIAGAGYVAYRQVKKRG
jgi:uncharacterized membrane protein